MSGERSEPICLSREELRTLLVSAARQGAAEAVETILGVEDGEHSDFRKDIIEIRNLLDAWRSMKRGTARQIGRLLAYALLLLLLLVAANMGHINWWSPFKQ